MCQHSCLALQQGT